VTLNACPVSVVTARSRAWLEEYFAWRLFGAHDYARLPARTVDAFSVIEKALQEANHARSHD
jgi:hypothetical protein